jgi:hypothetical protein
MAAPRLQPAVNRLTFERFEVTLLFVAIAAAASLMPAANDTWWHLREGEMLWHGASPLVDTFSHTAFAGYWQNREWLSQIAFYALYRIGGLPLLTAALAAVATGAWWLSWRLMTGPTIQRVALIAFALVTSSIEWSVRPQVFTLFFVALTALLIDRRAWLVLPLVFLLWANLHAGVLIGCVLLGVGVISSFMHESRREAALSFVAALLAFFTTALTPIGFALWTETFDVVRRAKAIGLSELQPARLDNWTLLPFWAITIALVILVVRARPWERDSPARRFVVLGALALVPVALIAGRNVPSMLLLGVPAVDTLVPGQLWRARFRRQSTERPLLNAALLAGALAIAVCAVGYSWLKPADRLAWNPLPAGLATATESCPARLYNRFDEGGYLIWFARGQKVFVDSRFDPFPTSLLQEQVRLEDSGDYQQLFGRFDIHCAVIPHDSRLASRLVMDGWQAVYDDAGWVVLTSERPLRVRASRLEEVP